MIPEDNSSDLPTKPEPAPAPYIPENGEPNGANGQYGVWPFDGPQSRRLTPEELEWAIQQFSREDMMAELREIEEIGGISSESFLQAIDHSISGET